MGTASVQESIAGKVSRGHILGYALICSVTFVVFELIAATPLAPLFFILLAAACGIGLVVWFRAAFLATLTLALLQTPYPVFKGYDTDLGINWYTLDVGPLSLIHYISLIVVLVGGIHIANQGRRVKENHMKWFLVLLLVGVTSLIMGIFYSFGWRELFIEFGEYGYLVGYFFLVLYMFRGEDRISLYNVVTIYIPLGIALGQATWQLPRLAGWEPYVMYTTANAYAFPTLLWHAFTSENDSLRHISIFAFLVGFTAIASEIGSSVLLGITGIMGLILIRQINSGRGGRTLLLMMLIILAATVAIFYQIVIQNNMFTLQKIYQIIGVITADSLYSIPNSTLIRILELYNIFLEISESIPAFLFGHGFGGYFTDAYFPFPSLSDEAFSEAQRATGKFFSPHNNPQWILLKHGVAGTAIWAYFIWNSIHSALRSRAERAVIGAVLVPSLFVLYGWGVNSALLIGVLGALFLQLETSTR